MESIEQVNYIKAPIETVYQTLTSEEGLGNVWTKKLKVKPEIGFVNEFDFDEGYITKFKTVGLEENKKIVWECIVSDEEWIGTKVSFELTKKDNTTTVLSDGPPRVRRIYASDIRTNDSHKLLAHA